MRLDRPVGEKQACGYCCQNEGAETMLLWVVFDRPPQGQSDATDCKVEPSPVDSTNFKSGVLQH